MGNCISQKKKPIVVSGNRANAYHDGPDKNSKKKEQNYNPLHNPNYIQGIKGNVEQDYTLLMPPLGKGAFGEVRKAIQKDTRLERAVKIIYKDKSNPAELQKIIDEVNILQKLDHPHILNVHQYYNSPSHLYIVTELARGGELFDKIIAKGRYSEEEAANVMEQVLQGVTFCHDRGIVHRDLKPENIIYQTKKPDSVVKIIDFGTQVEAHGKRLHERIGTPYYISPEVLKGVYGPKCDVWSCGVILYILLQGIPPFNGRNDREILERVKAGKFSMNKPQFKYVSREAKDLIQKMLTYDPERRLQASQAYKHKWFKKVHSNQKNMISQEAMTNLRNFTNKNKLTRALYYFLVDNVISDQEKKNLIQTFKALDTNGDGYLSREEIKSGYKKTGGITQTELNKLMDQIDTDGNKEINFKEFVAASVQRDQILTDQRIEACFKLFDKDRSGTISINEFKEMLGARDVSNSMWSKALSEADSNRDGFIDIVEFKGIFKKLLDERRSSQGFQQFYLRF